jgi:hypothetical protein
VLAVNLLLVFVCRQAVLEQPAPDYNLKLQAAQQAAAAQKLIGPRLLGEEYTFITTTPGFAGGETFGRSSGFCRGGGGYAGPGRRS